MEIDPDRGLLGLMAGKATRREVEATLGKPTEVVEHGSFSVELSYARGLSAIYCQKDPQQTIRWLQVRRPLAGVLRPEGKEAIVLGKSRMSDVLEGLGRCEWTTSDGSPIWTCSYRREGGRELGFSVERDPSVPQFPLDVPRHSKRVLVQIQLAAPGGCG